MGSIKARIPKDGSFKAHATQGIIIATPKDNRTQQEEPSLHPTQRNKFVEQRSPTVPGTIDQEGSVALEQIEDGLGRKKGIPKRSDKGDSQDQGSENSFQATQKTSEQVAAEVLQTGEQLGTRIFNQ